MKAVISRIVCVCVALVGVFIASAAKMASAEGSSRPNILMIFTDDQRFNAIGYANPEVHTPNLDRLAQDGVIFENCFVNTSICAISRANIITGQYPLRHGVTDFFKILSPDQLKDTYPAMLKRNGYYTGFVGKWGMGHTIKNTYTALPAFDFWAGASHQTLYWHERDCPYVTQNGRANICTCGPDANGVKGPDDRRIGCEYLKDPIHTDTDIFPLKVEQFLDAADPNQPFCLSLFYKGPHSPFQDWDTFTCRDLYKEQPSFTIPETATMAFAQRRPDFLKSDKTMLGCSTGYRWLQHPETLQKHLRDYYRLVSGVDLSVGRIRKILEKRGLAENTVILFTSDNGHFKADHGFAGKWLMREPSLRVPGFVYDPRLPEAKRGRRIAPMVTTIDYTATIMDLAGLSVPEHMQGHSFLSLVRDSQPKTAWPTEFFYEHPYGHGGGKLPLIWGVRTERYKYTRYISQDPPFEELFDLKEDPNEAHNLIDSPEHAALLKPLRRKTDQYAQRLK